MQNTPGIDALDLKILKALQDNSRRPFQEIARDLNVSGGTVHVRVNKMKELGIIEGTRVMLNPTKLGYDVCAYVGVNLHNARDCDIVVEKIRDFLEIQEIHYTTGTYSMFLKVFAKTTKGLHHFLSEKLHSLPEIQSTETFISLDKPFEREVPIQLDVIPRSDVISDT